MLNRWCGIGNLGRDPECRYTASGDAVVNFPVAVSKRWKSKQTGEQNEQTTWVRCVAFRQTAEFLAQYAGKGDRLYVEGELQERKWTDKTGQERYTTEITQCHVQLLGSKSEGRKPKPEKEPVAAGEDFDDDIPW